MIEIREVKGSDEGQRDFAFFEGEKLLGSLHLHQLNRWVAHLTSLISYSQPQIDDHVVMEGLVRTACNTLHHESVKWLLASGDLVETNETLQRFFVPSTQHIEFRSVELSMPEEDRLQDHWVMNTGSIYETGCTE